MSSLKVSKIATKAKVSKQSVVEKITTKNNTKQVSKVEIKPKVKSMNKPMIAVIKAKPIIVTKSTKETIKPLVKEKIKLSKHLVTATKELNKHLVNKNNNVKQVKEKVISLVKPNNKELIKTMQQSISSVLG